MGTANQFIDETNMYGIKELFGKEPQNCFRLCRSFETDATFEIFQLPHIYKNGEQAVGVKVAMLDNGMPFMTLMVVLNNHDPHLYPSIIDHLNHNLILSPKNMLCRADCFKAIRRAITEMSLYDGKNPLSAFGYGDDGKWRIQAFKNYLALANELLNRWH